MQVQYITIVISLFSLAILLLCTWAAVIIWAVRQEGRINLEHERVNNLSDKLSNAIAALSKFDENTQKQVEDYRLHTDIKIDSLDRSISAKLEKIFDKLDGKVDK